MVNNSNSVNIVSLMLCSTVYATLVLTKITYTIYLIHEIFNHIHCSLLINRMFNLKFNFAIFFLEI